MVNTSLSTLLFYPIIIFVGVSIVVLLMGLLVKAKPWPYRKKPLMSPIEKKLFWQLKEAFPYYYVFSQVNLSQAITFPKNNNQYKWLNKIWNMSLDFVLLDNQLEILLAIELDDKSHLAPNRKAADERKNKALKSAGIPLIRIQANNIPSIKQLTILINKTLLTHL